MKKILLLIVILIGSRLMAQQSSIQGVVGVFNSEFETGKRQYVANAQVEEDYGKSQATTTTSGGFFKLKLIGIKNLEKVVFSVKKPSFEVVNTTALQAIAGQKTSIQVYMAPEGSIAENKLKYYKINRQVAERALMNQITGIGQEIEELQKNARANQGEIKILQSKYVSLQESFKKIDDNVRELAEHYAITNLDDKSKDYQKAFRYFQKGQLDSALWVFSAVNIEMSAENILGEQERNQSLIKEYLKRDSSKNMQKRQVNDALTFKANLHQAKFEFDKAEDCYHLMFRLDSLNVYTLWNYSSFLQFQNKNSKAIPVVEKALALTKDDELKATFLNNLGGLYKINLNMQQAEEAYLKAIAIRKALVRKNPKAFTFDLVETLNNLGGFYLSKQQFVKCETALNEAIMLQLPYVAIQSEETLPTFAQSMNNLGKYFLITNNSEKARASFLAASMISERLSNDNPYSFLYELAGNLNNLGVYYRDNQNVENSENAYLEALEILRKLAEINADAFLPDLASTLNNLGVLYLDGENSEKCETTLLEALQIQRRLVNKNPTVVLPSMSQTLSNLGMYYNKNPDRGDAEKTHLEALQIQRKLAADNPEFFSADLAAILHNMGSYYQGKNKLNDAEKLYQEALQILNQLNSKESNAFLPNMASTLNNIGTLYNLLNKHELAIHSLEEAIKIRENSILKGQNQYLKDWGQVLGNLAAVRDSTFSRKKYTNSCKVLKIIAESCDSLKSMDNEILAYSVYQYGTLSWWTLFIKDFPTSEKAALRCLELDEKQQWVLSNLGHSYLLRGQYSAAKATYEKLKGKKDREGKDYKQAILDDLNALEVAGITHKDFAQARAAIEKW